MHAKEPLFASASRRLLAAACVSLAYNSASTITSLRSETDTAKEELILCSKLSGEYHTRTRQTCDHGNRYYPQASLNTSRTDCIFFSPFCNSSRSISCRVSGKNLLATNFTICSIKNEMSAVFYFCGVQFYSSAHMS